MRKYLAVIMAVVLLSGCKSMTPERLNTIAAIAGSAAAVGSAIYLTEHPEHKPAFDAVVLALATVLATSATNEVSAETNYNKFVERLSSLPPEAQLKSAEGELYLSDAPKGEPSKPFLVVWDATLRKPVKIEPEQSRAVMRSTLAGLRKAVGPRPPVPVAVKKVGRKQILPE